MKLTISIEDNIFQVDITDELEVENLIAYCEAESGSSFRNLVLIHNGHPISDLKKTLKEYQISDGDMIYVMPKTTRQASQDQQSSSRLSINTPTDAPVVDITLQQAIQIRDSFLSNPIELAAIKQNNPQLAEALERNNIDEFRKVLNEQCQRRKEEQDKRIRMLTADPFDVEAQRMIAEEIKREQIDSNMQSAIEYLPEAFGQVHMLYIKCKVNGYVIDAFVDSGAQSTIMSKACADRCNVTRLIDNRWSGVAQGVGTQKILGRIHMCLIQIENDHLACSFSVLEHQPMDMLLGLDMLKRHQCLIDLKENILKIGTTGSQTPFLAESEIQKSRASTD